MTQGPYHLIALGTLLLLSYFISLIWVRTKLLSLQAFRKFWNILLLVFFISTAILGLLLAVRANYKLKIEWLDEAMQWHVDSGIGFALVAIFHLFWHLRYYFRRPPVLSENTGKTAPWSPYLSFSQSEERSFFILLGYLSIMAQLVLLREFIKSFHGNEIVIGIFLAAWMILTALGAKMGAGYRLRIPERWLYFLLFMLGLLPLVIYLLILLSGRLLFLPGVQAGLLDTAILIVLLTGIFTTISGFLFGFISGAVDQKRAGSSAYRLDSIGSVAGGVLFAFVLVHLMDNIHLLTFLFLTTTMAMALLYKYPIRTIWRIIFILLAAGLFTFSMMPQFKNNLEELRFKGEKILDTRDTPYGNLSFTSRDEQLSGYMDGNPLFSSSDLTGAEESVHFPALQRPNPRSFLLLGGGTSGHIAEVAKYNPRRIDYCEANPWIFKMGQVHLQGKKSEALQFIPKDGRSWLKKAENEKYDVVISTASNPMTLGWNRYFTLEFFRMVKAHLAPGGVFCMRLSTADNYVNEEGIRLLAINMKTLNEEFSHVLIVPGSASYFLASDQPLSIDFPALLAGRDIATSYVHPDYLDASHLLFDSDQLSMRVQQEKAEINTDLMPRLFFAALSNLESRTGKHSMSITGLLSALIFLLLLFSYSRKKRAMYISGFTGAGIQIVLIMVVQSFYGFAYMVAPMMITLFMAGIVAGTYTFRKLSHKSDKEKLPALLLIMALLSLAASLLLGRNVLFDTRWLGQVILGILNFIPGVVVGSVYTSGVEDKDSTPGTRGALYSADLTGAALGTFIPALFLLPLFGVRNTFILFFGINLLAGLSLVVRGFIKKGDG